MNFIQQAYNPFAHLENPELKRTKENSHQTPEDLAKATKYAKKVFGSFNPDALKTIPKEPKEEIPEDPFEVFHKYQQEGIYYPNDIILDTEIPQFEDAGIEQIPTSFSDNSDTRELLKKYKEAIENNPIFPIVERLYEQGQITEETFNQIGNYLSNNENLDINKIKFNNPEEKKVLEGCLNNLNFDNLNREQNLLELTQDIKKIPTLKKLKIKINPDGTFEDEVLNKVGKNYIKIPDSNGNFNIEKDFSTAILTTKNEILKEVKNLKKDSETYRQAIKNINSGNLKKQLEGIKSLYILAYSNEGILGKKTIEDYKKSRKKALIKEAQKIEQTLQQQKLNEQQIKQLEKRKEEIKEELSEITGIKDGKKIKGGDIFTATKQETNDNGQTEKEQSI